MGPPGSGKGTQARHFVDQCGWRQLSTGDLFRFHLANGTVLGSLARGFMDKGNYVPDEVTISMVREKIGETPLETRIIFDGFPRTIPQARALDQMLKLRSKKIDLVIELKVDDKVLIDRVKTRIAQSGGVARADDTAETLQNRLAVYYQNTAPLLEYYKRQSKLSTVDGMAPIEAVTEAINDVIQAGGQLGMVSKDGSIKNLFAKKLITRETAVEHMRHPDTLGR